MTIHRKALEEHFLIVPLLFGGRGECIFWIFSENAKSSADGNQEKYKTKYASYLAVVKCAEICAGTEKLPEFMAEKAPPAKNGLKTYDSIVCCVSTIWHSSSHFLAFGVEYT
jgi:hypothetical protein